FDAATRLTGITDGTNTTSYGYDVLDRITDRNTDAFTYAGFEQDATGDGTNTYQRSPSGGLLAHHDTAGVTHPITNIHRDLIALTDGAGDLAHTRTYNPYGEVQNETGTSDPLLGYQTDWTDPTTDHVWMGARWYQPSSGTFLTRDTYAGQLQTPFTLNRYTYANNNPNRYWDPTGHAGQWPGFEPGLGDPPPAPQPDPEGLAPIIRKPKPPQQDPEGLSPIIRQPKPAPITITQAQIDAEIANIQIVVVSPTPRTRPDVSDREDELCRSSRFLPTVSHVCTVPVAIGDGLVTGTQGLLGEGWSILRDPFGYASDSVGGLIDCGQRHVNCVGDAASALTDACLGDVNDIARCAGGVLPETGAGIATGGSSWWQRLNSRLRKLAPDLPEWSPPPGFRKPKDDLGEWKGTTGNSAWTPKDPARWDMSPGASVPFVNGTPDFSSFVPTTPGGGPGSIDVPGLTGNRYTDALLAIEKVAERDGLASPDVQAWIRNEKLQLHHFECTIQFVPAATHRIAHQGSVAAISSGDLVC
ncbi:MAG: RHS repeat-associated core domain-containing protein, partial [Sulfitobacter sp.]|nr:RHS repeat-associated core domain-containing protein [Sulfitobacter sp.]